MTSDHLFDVVVIGGGITGAGIARDAAMRGFSTLLVEKEDFGHATTSRSPRVVDGGEQTVLERIAAHLVRPLGLLLPVYRGDRRPLWVVGAGLRLEAWLARERRSGLRTVGPREALRLEPALERRGLTGAALYASAQVVSPERLCLENVLAAREAGAKAVNHVEATGLAPRGDGVTEVTVRNLLTGEGDMVAGRVVINATGPWGDGVRRMAGLWRPPAVRFAKRVHVVLPRVTGQALLVRARSDGRMLVVLPWKAWSLVGTAHAEAASDPDAAAPTPEEVDYLLSETRRVVPGTRLTTEHVLDAYAAVGPCASAWTRPSAGARRRRGVLRAEGPRGTVLSVAGGALASYRSLAEEVTDRVAALLGRAVSCSTADTPLHGGHLASLERALSTDAPALARRFGVPPATAATLVETYGSRAAQVLGPVARDATLARRLCDRSPDIVAQVKHAVDHEYALSLEDLLFRRLAAGTGPCRGRDCARRAADAMARFARWDDRRTAREVAAYLAEVDLVQRSRADGTEPARAGARPLRA